MKCVDLTGRQFGKLTVVSQSFREGATKRWWRCKCSCGEISVVPTDKLTSGHTKSCGCGKYDGIRISGFKHGLSQTYKREFRIWCAMRRRCTDTNSPDYPAYGGRGISVQPQWLDFKTFIEDMGPCPPGMSIERSNNNQGYGPDNCKWATAKEQANNRRPTKSLTWNNQQWTMSELGRQIGLSPSGMQKRIRKLGLERAMNLPIQENKKTRAKIGNYDS